MRRHTLPGGPALAFVLCGLLASFPALAAPPDRPATWATAVAGTSVGNLYLVAPGVYRSAQPSPQGFRQLEVLGIKSVLDVSGGNDEVSTKGTKLKLFHVPMTAWGLRDGRVREALAILANPANQPILIHCQHGADRTGAIVALYRVLLQGWSKAEAVREMAEGGYHHSSLWRNLDRYVLAADVELLRGSLGLAKAGTSSPLPQAAAAAAAAGTAVVAAPATAANDR